MDVSGGNVTITESMAQMNGGSGGAGRFLVPGTGTRDPPKKWHAERHGLCSFGRRVLRAQGLRGLQADATAAATQQVISFKATLSARVDSATAVYMTKIKMAESGP